MRGEKVYMRIFSTIEIKDGDNSRTYFLTDENARYLLKESVYQGEKSKFYIYHNPYENMNGEEYQRFSLNENTMEYYKDMDGFYLYNEETESYYNPLEGKDRFSKVPMYIKDQFGDYIYDTTKAAFVIPYEGVKRYKSEGEFTYVESPDGEYLYDPLLMNANNGFYNPYADKNDITIKYDRYAKNGNSYILHTNGKYLYDADTGMYYDPYYDKNDQSIPLPRYNIGTDIVYIEDELGALIHDDILDIYYNPYDDVQRYSISEELSSFKPDEEGLYIEVEPFDAYSKPEYGFYYEFPEWKMDKEEFVLGQEDIFSLEKAEDEDFELVERIDIDDAEFEIGSIDRLNGQPLRDEVKLRLYDYKSISGGQKYSITNDNNYWMQIFEYKQDTVINEMVFVRSYKVNYGFLFTTHPLTTHIKVASGDKDTLDLTHVQIRLVTDPDVEQYVFTGPIFETYDEAYKNGHYYFFDSNDRSQFCKLVGDGENCQAYERYQISTKVLKTVSEIHDATNQALSRITQTGAEISMEVQSTARNLRSYFQQQMNVIRLEVIDKDNELHSQIQLTADAISHLVTSEYSIIGHRSLSSSEIQHSISFPENYNFSEIHPMLNNEFGIFEFEEGSTINTDYISAYEKKLNYFVPVTKKMYVEDSNGLYIFNGTYYNPYDKAIEDGGHRYSKITSGESANGDPIYEYVINDESGIYIRLNENTYYNPYEDSYGNPVKRYEEYPVFCRLTYNMVDGYGYDIYTSSSVALSSLIEQTASKIRLEVSEETGSLRSRIELLKEGIVFDVVDIENRVNSKIQMNTDSINSVVSTGSVKVVYSDSSLLPEEPSPDDEEAIGNYFSIARPMLDSNENKFVFNAQYEKAFLSNMDAYDENYIYFSYILNDGYAFVKFSEGEYILNENGEYVKPYEGYDRYTKIDNHGKDDQTPTSSYIKDDNGSYIRILDDDKYIYKNPLLDSNDATGKTRLDRYTKTPAYCELAKTEYGLTVNVIISGATLNESNITQTSKSISSLVSGISGVSSSLQQTAQSIKSMVKDSNTKTSTEIEQTKDKIEAVAKSQVICVAETSTIPSNIQSGANIWYIDAPRYDSETNSLIFNQNKSEIYTSHQMAYQNNHLFLNGGEIYLLDSNGKYVYDNGIYFDPYDGTKTRYSKTIDWTYADSYIEDDNGDYINENGSYISIYDIEDYDSIDVNTVKRYIKKTNATSTEVYIEDEHGEYIENNDGDYYIPYIDISGNPVNRFEVYPAFIQLSYSVNDDKYTLSTYIYNDLMRKTELRQTADGIYTHVSDESNGLTSSVSQTASEIRSELISKESQSSTEIKQTADYIKMVSKSGTEMEILKSESVSLDISNFYSMPPAYDHENNRYDFADTEYVLKCRYVGDDVALAISKGYIYFENIKDCFVKDPNGNYLQDEYGEYYDPYIGQTRYTNDTYVHDENDEGNSEGYSVSENGRYLYDSAKDEYYDPFVNQDTGFEYERYKKITPEQTYNRFDDIVRKLVKYEFPVPDDESFVETGIEVILVIGDRAVRFKSAFSMFMQFSFVYDVTSNKVIHMLGDTELASVSDIEIIPWDSSNEITSTVLSDYKPHYNDTYNWTTIVNMPLLYKTSFELSDDRVKLMAEDMNGYSSKIVQNAHSITSMIKGAPIEIETLTGNDAISILENIKKFYNNIPVFTNGDFSFSHLTPYESSDYMIAYKNAYPYFEDSRQFIYDPDGLYIKRKVDKPKEYIYYNPKDNPSITTWYNNYAGIYIESSDGLWYIDSSGEYVCPWEGISLEDRFDYSNGAYTQNDNGLYIRIEDTSKIEYEYYSPHSDQDRYSKIYESSEMGRFILVDDKYVDPFADGENIKTHYYKKYTKIEVIENSEIDITNDYIYDEDEDFYYLPYFDKYSQNIALLRYDLVNDNKSEDSNLPDIYELNPDGEYILNENGEYVKPYENKDIYNYSFEIIPTGAEYIDEYYVVTSSHENFEDAELGPDGRYYYNPYKNKLRFNLVYKIDENGRYLRKSLTEYYDPYKDITDRYIKYPMYAKVIKIANEYAIVYYGNMNEKISSQIEQTGSKIGLSVSDESADRYNQFYISNEEIRTQINNLREDVITTLRVSDNQLLAKIADMRTNLTSKITVNADSIESTVSGSYALHNSGKFVMSQIEGGKVDFYNIVPLFNGTHFENRGYYKTFYLDVVNSDLAEEVNLYIEDGYKYSAIVPNTEDVTYDYLKTDASESSTYKDVENNTFVDLNEMETDDPYFRFDRIKTDSTATVTSTKVTVENPDGVSKGKVAIEYNDNIYVIIIPRDLTRGSTIEFIKVKNPEPETAEDDTDVENSEEVIEEDSGTISEFFKVTIKLTDQYEVANYGESVEYFYYKAEEVLTDSSYALLNENNANDIISGIQFASNQNFTLSEDVDIENYPILVYSYIENEKGPYIGRYLNGDVNTFAEIKLVEWFTKIPVYRKYKNASINGTDLILEYDQYTKTDDVLRSEIVQTSGMIRQTISNDMQNISSRLLQTDRRISLEVYGLKTDVMTKFSVTRDSIESLVSGNYIIHETKTIITDSIVLRDSVPDYDDIANKFVNSTENVKTFVITPETADADVAELKEQMSVYDYRYGDITEEDEYVWLNCDDKIGTHYRAVNASGETEIIEKGSTSDVRYIRSNSNTVNREIDADGKVVYHLFMVLEDDICVEPDTVRIIGGIANNIKFTIATSGKLSTGTILDFTVTDDKLTKLVVIYKDTTIDSNGDINYDFIDGSDIEFMFSLVTDEAVEEYEYLLCDFSPSFTFVKDKYGDYYYSGSGTIPTFLYGDEMKDFHKVNWLFKAPAYRRYNPNSVVTNENKTAFSLEYDLYIRSADSYTSNITQTANMLRSTIKNNRTNTQSTILQLEDRITMEVRDLTKDLTTKFSISNTSIDSLVSGTYIVMGSDSITIETDGVYPIAYYSVPNYSGGRFYLVGTSINYEPPIDKIEEAILEGYVYDNNEDLFVLATNSDATHYGYRDGNNMKYEPITGRYTVSGTNSWSWEMRIGKRIDALTAGQNAAILPNGTKIRFTLPYYVSEGSLATFSIGGIISPTITNDDVASGVLVIDNMIIDEKDDNYGNVLKYTYTYVTPEEYTTRLFEDNTNGVFTIIPDSEKDWYFSYDFDSFEESSNYVESDDGEYILLNNAYVTPIFYKTVPSYKKYRYATANDDGSITLTYDIYIRSDDKYVSEFTNAANMWRTAIRNATTGSGSLLMATDRMIKLQVTNFESKVGASINILENRIENVIETNSIDAGNGESTDVDVLTSDVIPKFDESLQSYVFSDSTETKLLDEKNFNDGYVYVTGTDDSFKVELRRNTSDFIDAPATSEVILYYSDKPLVDQTAHNMTISSTDPITLYFQVHETAEIICDDFGTPLKGTGFFVYKGNYYDMTDTAMETPLTADSLGTEFQINTIYSRYIKVEIYYINGNYSYVLTDPWDGICNPEITVDGETRKLYSIISTTDQEEIKRYLKINSMVVRLKASDTEYIMSVTYGIFVNAYKKITGIDVDDETGKVIKYYYKLQIPSSEVQKSQSVQDESRKDDRIYRDYLSTTGEVRTAVGGIVTNLDGMNTTVSAVAADMSKKMDVNGYASGFAWRLSTNAWNVGSYLGDDKEGLPLVNPVLHVNSGGIEVFGNSKFGPLKLTSYNKDVSPDASTQATVEVSSINFSWTNGITSVDKPFYIGEYTTTVYPEEMGLDNSYSFVDKINVCTVYSNYILTDGINTSYIGPQYSSERTTTVGTIFTPFDIGYFKKLYLNGTEITGGSSGGSVSGDVPFEKIGYFDSYYWQIDTRPPSNEIGDVGYIYTGCAVVHSRLTVGIEGVGGQIELIGGAQIVNGSDRRLKYDIEYMSDCDIFDSLKIVSFKYKDDLYGKLRYGVIANDVYDLLIEKGYNDINTMPIYVESKRDVITEDGESSTITMGAINYIDLIPINILQTQKLKIRTKTLEEKYEELSKKYSDLEEKFNNLAGGTSIDGNDTL